MESPNQLKGYTEILTSKHNAGWFQIIRMDGIWLDANRHSRRGELDKWNWDLDAMWRELCGDIKKILGSNERKKKFLIFDNYRKKIAELRNELAEKKINLEEYRYKFYRVMERKEIFLRKLQNELGKGTSYVDETEDDFE